MNVNDHNKTFYHSKGYISTKDRQQSATEMKDYKDE